MQFRMEGDAPMGSSLVQQAYGCIWQGIHSFIHSFIVNRLTCGEEEGVGSGEVGEEGYMSVKGIERIMGIML
jgi:hypothetical protein